MSEYDPLAKLQAALDAADAREASLRFRLRQQRILTSNEIRTLQDKVVALEAELGECKARYRRAMQATMR